MNTFKDALPPGPPPSLHYPIVYTPPVLARAATVAVSFFYVAMIAYVAFDSNFSGGHLPFLIKLMAFLGLYIAFYAMAWAWVGSITLYADRLEKRMPFERRSLAIVDIAGRRSILNDGKEQPVIVMKSGKRIALDPDTYGLDNKFDRWMAQLPDLEHPTPHTPVARAPASADAIVLPEVDEAVATFHTPVARAPAPGDAIVLPEMNEAVTPAPMRRSGWGMAGMILGTVAIVLFFFSLRDGPVVLLFTLNTLVFWSALLVLWKLNSLAEKPVKLQALAMVIPVGSIAVLAVDQSHLIHSQGVITWAGVFAAMFTVGALLVRRGQVGRPDDDPATPIAFMIPALLLSAWLYVGSTLALLNRTLDSAPPRMLATHVIDKELYRGRQFNQYFLTLDGPDLFKGGKDLRVEADRFRSTPRGSVLCVGLHPGWLGYRWTQIAPCSGAQVHQGQSR